MEIKKHKYTEQEAYQNLSALCASAEYCEADLRKKMRNWVFDSRCLACAQRDKGSLLEQKVDPHSFSEIMVDDDDLGCCTQPTQDQGIQTEAEGANTKNRIIARLRSEKFIDDERYARAYVRDKFRYNHWGKVRISQELRMRKIASEIIDKALEEIPEGDNLESLRRIIESKRKSVKGKSEYDIRCKLIRFALGRGFDLNDIMEVLENLDD